MDISDFVLIPLILLGFWFLIECILHALTKRDKPFFRSLGIVVLVTFGAAGIFKFLSLDNEPKVSTIPIAEEQSFNEDTEDPTSVVKIYKPEDLKETFSNLSHSPRVMRVLEEMKMDIQKRPQFTQFGIKAPNGFLFYGPPGNGKSHLAKVFAKEANATLVMVSGSDLRDMYVGNTAKTIGELFRGVRDFQPCILFIDEIDSLAMSRQREGAQPIDFESVNKLLFEIDALRADPQLNVTLMAASNHISQLDPALLRSGRFDKKVYIPLPQIEQRTELTRQFFSRIKLLKENIDYKDIATQTSGFSVADLQNLVNTTAVIAIKNNKKPVMTSQDVQMAFEQMSADFNTAASSMTQSKTHLSVDIVFPEKIESGFEQVFGLEEIKQELQEVITFFKMPEKLQKKGAKVANGVLLYGPPGTGKTLLAQAMAKMGQVNLIATSGSSFSERYVGVGASRVRELFQIARELKPCIIFIDEIDSLGASRDIQTNSDLSQTLNQFLVEIDSLNQQKNSEILVIAATNRKDNLDSALLRPGRFDKKVRVPLPRLEDRKKILNHLFSAASIQNVDTKKIALMTQGFSGAQLKNLVNEAILESLRNENAVIMEKDLEKALDKVTIGLGIPSAQLDEKTRQIAAYHEAGHTLVGWFLENFESGFRKVSIGLRGQSLGVTWFDPKDEAYFYSKRYLEQRIALSLGGRAAEEIAFGAQEITSGASNDIEKATDLALRMVAVFGLDPKMGLLNYSKTSAHPSKEVIQSAKHILDEQYVVAKSILIKHRALLDAVANELLEKETLSREQIENMINSFNSN